MLATWRAVSMMEVCARVLGIADVSLVGQWRRAVDRAHYPDQPFPRSANRGLSTCCSAYPRYGWISSARPAGGTARRWGDRLWAGQGLAVAGVIACVGRLLLLQCVANARRTRYTNFCAQGWPIGKRLGRVCRQDSDSASPLCELHSDRLVDAVARQCRQRMARIYLMPVETTPTTGSVCRPPSFQSNQFWPGRAGRRVSAPDPPGSRRRSWVRRGSTPGSSSC